MLPTSPTSTSSASGSSSQALSPSSSSSPGSGAPSAPRPVGSPSADAPHTNNGVGSAALDLTFGLGAITSENRNAAKRTRVATPRPAPNPPRKQPTQPQQLVRFLRYGGRIWGVTNDELDCFSFLTGLFSVLSIEQREKWLESDKRSPLYFRGCALVLPVAGGTQLPSAFHRALPIVLDSANIWEIRRVRLGVPPAQTFVEGALVRQCMLQLHQSRVSSSPHSSSAPLNAQH